MRILPQPLLRPGAYLWLMDIAEWGEQKTFGTQHPPLASVGGRVQATQLTTCERCTHLFLYVQAEDL